MHLYGFSGHYYKINCIRAKRYCLSNHHNLASMSLVLVWSFNMAQRHSSKNGALPMFSVWWILFYHRKVYSSFQTNLKSHFLCRCFLIILLGDNYPWIFWHFCWVRSFWAKGTSKAGERMMAQQKCLGS